MTTGIRKGLVKYGDPGFSFFLRRASINSLGHDGDALARPTIGIIDTASARNARHAAVPEQVEVVERGAMLTGGLPMPFPTVSVHETFFHPAGTFLRNLMAMDTAEMIRARSMDELVMVGGCEETAPAQPMTAASGSVPAVGIVTGPRLMGHHEGEMLGACTDCQRPWGRFRAGEIDEAEMDVISGRPVPTTAALRGNLAPGGAIIERAAVSPDPLRHTDHVLVLDGVESTAPRIDAAVDEAEPERRCAEWVLPHPGSDRGHLSFLLHSALQADEGCDFTSLVPGRLPSARA